VAVRFIRQYSIRRTLSNCVSIFDAQHALALLNEVDRRQFIDRFIALKDMISKYRNYWCVIVTVVL